MLTRSLSPCWPTQNPARQHTLRNAFCASTLLSTHRGAGRAWKQLSIVNRFVLATGGVEGQRWPEFLEAAREEGVLAALSVPLILDAPEPHQHGELVGSLNIYSRNASAFDPFDEELMRLYTVAASQAITNARR